MTRFSSDRDALRQYLMITINYWCFTLTDGALRMLVVLYFYGLDYSPLQIASLFLFYEFFGVVTNLVGGWLGARLGLNKTMNIGLAIQVIALSMLLVPNSWLSVIWAMIAQALSGIAKDLNKMSAKSAIKVLIPENKNQQLFRWIAFLTGSKNALKGVGFFLGGLLLAVVGFWFAILLLCLLIATIWIVSLFTLRRELAQSSFKPKFTDIFSKSKAVNVLSAARCFLFGARDVWFVIAVPIFLSQHFSWDHWQVGSFLAIWVIGYGVIQSVAPLLTQPVRQQPSLSNDLPMGTVPFQQLRRQALIWSGILFAVMLSLAITSHQALWSWLIPGLILFGFVFAINSSLHSYLIIQYSRRDGVSMDVGFYYMANAMGRLIGTVLSGWLFQLNGLELCLWVAAGFIAITWIISLALPNQSPNRSTNPMQT
ncbi:organoarsenical effux MFS transporter ArsJ [Pleionea litopenaei]|uniref:Organoarsenical effux MFS transporter ArsJ n=1 Tax=Pleionea litopenaei TaxID=3070815 RepID=A0AA51RUP3_9GAMM|nr:organoarsenical effux MFS transporter ArsJ [Pleionea sp. HL-JVS1]WMS87915.1 organoarsenical effux MFS transporter ArsJ [Pleionea sp. HL-JVS1]